MGKKLQLQVPVPCHEDWENMTRAEKGRFCSSCHKTVMDFSNMSDREIAAFFKKRSTGSVCGRFMENQLNRDIDIPRKRIPWIRYFFQFLLPGFLISMKATAQGKVRVVQKETRVFVKNSKVISNDRSTGYAKSKCTVTLGVVAPVIEAPKLPMNNEVLIHGEVVDENDNPVPFATVIIKGTKNATAADSNGIFTLKPARSWDSIRVVVSAVGFSSTESMIRKTDLNSNAIVLVKAGTSMGEVVVTGLVENHRKGMVMSVITTSNNYRIPTPVEQTSLKVYPNPIKTGSTLKIEWNQKQFGDYSLQLFNQAGQLVFRKEIFIDVEARLLSIGLPRLSAGSYFVRITSKATTKSYSEKIIIQ